MQETKELLASRKLEHLPVIAIEDCEAFLSGFAAKDVHAHDLSRQGKKTGSFEVTGPDSFDASFQSAVDVASLDIPADGFEWAPGVKYSAGLIPMRMGENGQLEVLLLKRHNLALRDRGVWATPGGNCKPGKDGNPLASAIRETQEELGAPLAGKVELKPIVLNNPKSSRCFHGYPWLVDSGFRPKLQFENTDSKWVPLSEIEPESPQIMGECGAVLRHLVASSNNSAKNTQKDQEPVKEEAGTKIQAAENVQQTIIDDSARETVLNGDEFSYLGKAIR